MGEHLKSMKESLETSMSYQMDKAKEELHKHYKNKEQSMLLLFDKEVQALKE